MFAWQEKQSLPWSVTIMPALLDACASWQVRHDPLLKGAWLDVASPAFMRPEWHSAQRFDPAAFRKFLASEPWGVWQAAHFPSSTGL